MYVTCKHAIIFDHVLITCGFCHSSNKTVNLCKYYRYPRVYNTPCRANKLAYDVSQLQPLNNNVTVNTRNSGKGRQDSRHNFHPCLFILHLYFYQPEQLECKTNLKTFPSQLTIKICMRLAAGQGYSYFHWYMVFFYFHPL